MRPVSEGEIDMDAWIGVASRADGNGPRPAVAGIPLPCDELTAGELRVLQMLASGATNREIAAHAQISENTVKFHLKNVYGKLGVSSRAAAVFMASRLGLVTAAAA
jgi:DNA-binding CsgD family transcriptional regulator